MKKLILLFLLSISVFLQNINAQNKSKHLVRSTIGISGSSQKFFISNINCLIQQSIGQSSIIGTINTDLYVLRQGFIQPNLLSNILDKNIFSPLDIIQYPNPFIEKIYIKFNEIITSDIHIQIYDVLGRLLYTKIYPASNEIMLTLNYLPTANFFMHVKTNNKQIVKKIIKNN